MKRTVLLSLILIAIISIVPGCSVKNPAVTSSAEIAATVSAEASSDKTLFSDDLESTGSDWTLDPGWQNKNVDGNSLLDGNGHSFARLKGQVLSDYTMSFRLKIEEGSVHVCYRTEETNGGLNRYFIRISPDSITLNKQEDKTFTNDLSKTGWSLGNSWHDVKISGYQGIINVFIDGNLLLVYKDDNTATGNCIITMAGK